MIISWRKKYSSTQNPAPERRSGVLAGEGGLGGRGVAFYQLWPSDHGSRGADARARRMGGDGLACHVRRAVGCVAGAAAISAWGLPPARVRVPCVPSVSPCAMVAAFNAVTRSRGCPAPLHARTRLPCRHGEPVVPKRHARGDGCPWAGAARGLATIAGA